MREMALKPEVEKKIIGMYQQGACCGEISRILGVPYTRVTHLLREKHGLVKGRISNIWSDKKKHQLNCLVCTYDKMYYICKEMGYSVDSIRCQLHRMYGTSSLKKVKEIIRGDFNGKGLDKSGSKEN